MVDARMQGPPGNRDADSQEERGKPAFFCLMDERRQQCTTDSFLPCTASVMDALVPLAARQQSFYARSIGLRRRRGGPLACERRAMPSL